MSDQSINRSSDTTSDTTSNTTCSGDDHSWSEIDADALTKALLFTSIDTSDAIKVKKIKLSKARCRQGNLGPCSKHSIFCAACGDCLVALDWFRQGDKACSVIRVSSKGIYYKSQTPLCPKCHKRASKYDSAPDPTVEK